MAVFLHTFRTRNDSSMPSRVLGVTVRIPANAPASPLSLDNEIWSSFMIRK
jgi:hypothetical protein